MTRPVEQETDISDRDIVAVAIGETLAKTGVLPAHNPDKRLSQDCWKVAWAVPPSPLGSKGVEGTPPMECHIDMLSRIAAKTGDGTAVALMRRLTATRPHLIPALKKLYWLDYVRASEDATARYFVRGQGWTDHAAYLAETEAALHTWATT